MNHYKQVTIIYMLLTLYTGLVSMFVILIYKLSRGGEEDVPGGRTEGQLQGGSMRIRHRVDQYHLQVDRVDNEKEEYEETSINFENISTLEQEMRKG